MGTRLRRLFPPSGRAYELYDTATLIFALGLIGYVLTDPPTATKDALAPLRFITETELGWIIAIAGLCGMTFAYIPRLVRAGYVIAITAAGIMSLNFILGFLTNGLEPLRLLLSAVLYAWIARRLMRDNREAG